jgi:hypothetical protein
MIRRLSATRDTERSKQAGREHGDDREGDESGDHVRALERVKELAGS